MIMVRCSILSICKASLQYSSPIRLSFRQVSEGA
jgi:hypothetical protein